MITTVEQLFRSFAPMLEPYAPSLVGALYQALPGYHLANIADWLDRRAGCWKSPSRRAPFSMSVAASLAIAAAWIAVLTGLAFRGFRRQDIN